jgi:hypothetical protein
MQIDGTGVQSIDRIGEIQPEVYFEVDHSHLSNQDRCKIGSDFPTHAFVDLCQRTFLDQGPKPHAVESAWVGSQACLDIAQGLSPGQCREGHEPRVVGSRKGPHPNVAPMALQDPRKTCTGYELHDLCKQRLADVHCHLPPIIVDSGTLPIFASLQFKSAPTTTHLQASQHKQSCRLWNHLIGQ